MSDEHDADLAVRSILNQAASDIAAIDDIGGMATTVILAYTMMDGEGEPLSGDAYSGSLSTAIGLLEQTKHRYLRGEYE